MALIRLDDKTAFRPDAMLSYLRIWQQIGRKPGVNRTTVDYQTQADLRAEYLAGRYPNFVADPKLSKHVYRNDSDGGNAWDTEEYRNIKAILIDNGWDDEDDNEKWHWVYYSSQDNHLHDKMFVTTQQGDASMARNTGIAYTASDGRKCVKIFNTESGFEVDFDNGKNQWPGEVTTPIATAFDTPTWVPMSEGGARAISASLAQVRISKRG